MRSSIIFSAVSLLAQQTIAQADSVGALNHGSYVASRIRRKADINLNSGEYLRRHVEARLAEAEPEPDFVHRQAAPSASSSSAAPMPTTTGPVTLNPTMDDTDMACKHVLSTAKAPDDTGLAACYNINFFDNSTGYFQANVMIYNLTGASGNWSSLQPDSLHLSMSFPGATAQTQPDTAKKVKRDEATSTYDTAATPIRRTLTARSDGASLKVAYTLLGNVVAPFNHSLTNSTAMRQALTPTMSITAMTTGNMNMSANISTPTGAAFVNGYFSDAFIADKAAADAAAANPPPFKLPGTTLGFFPIGLITMSTWTALFVAIVGYGTINRIQWRSAYRAKKPNASGK